MIDAAALAEADPALGDPEVATIKPPISLYTELAAQNNGRLLAQLDEYPLMARAVLGLMVSLERFAWRGDHRLGDVGVRDGRGTVNSKRYAEFRATFYVQRSAEPTDDVQLRADEETDPVVYRNIRLAQVTHCPGVVRAAVAFCTAIEEYAARKGWPLREIGVPANAMRVVPGSAGEREFQALLSRQRPR